MVETRHYLVIFYFLLFTLVWVGYQVHYIDCIIFLLNIVNTETCFTV